MVVAALLAVLLTGCVPAGPTPSPSTTSSPSESPGRGEPRFLITCYYPDGSEVATFTRLEEAWASTNYVRIDHCEAAAAASDSFELTEEEAAIAAVAAADLAGDPTDLYLHTLAACVWIPPDADRGMTTYPDPILEAALVLCPEAPHAELIEAELARGTSG